MIRRPTTSHLHFSYSPIRFFFNDTATTEISPLSLHDALPISLATVDPDGMPWTRVLHPIWEASTGWIATTRHGLKARHLAHEPRVSLPDRVQHPSPWRSEEHTSELQSRSDLVCRLLLEKKKHR